MTLRKEDIALIKKLATQDQGVDEADAKQYRRILSTSGQWKSYSNQQPEFSIIAKRTHAVVESNKKTRVAKHWMVAASVTIALLLASWLIFFNKNIVIQAPIAEMETVWLPDSSRVILNANARLSYSRKKWKKHKRTVQLTGIAYFEVRKGSRFVVETHHGEVAVLGTSFNVKALSEDFIVECITGKVAVSQPELNQSVVLTPGLKIESQQSMPQLVPETFDTIRGKEWVSGIFNFDKQPLKRVWGEIERQFDVSIQYENNSSRYYTGSFSNSDLEKALQAICKPMGLRYSVDSNGKKIRIIMSQ